MIITIINVIIAVFFLGLLIFLHELGHFAMAKKEDVKVEEFGFGYPPRIFGKKFGETIYSLNWIPFGGFVKITGEEREDGKIPESRSFYAKSLWARIKIIVAGAGMFWVIAFVVLSILHMIGVPTAIEDNVSGNFPDAKIQIVQVENGSPAEKAGIKAGDFVNNLKFQNETIKIEKVGQFQNLAKQYAGKEIKFDIQRGKDSIELSITPRENPPTGEGPLGVALIRVAAVKYSWYESIWQGAVQTVKLTISYIQGLFNLIRDLFVGNKISGFQMMGPVGISQLNFQMLQLGINYFLNLLVVISIALAISNLLPIPSLDGGKLMFLIIEAIKGSPVNAKVENTITSVVFILLLILMAFITYNDILRLF
jgi:regulator of sigma E protease